MSECELIFQRFHRAIIEHRARSGNPATVCVLGSNTYDSFVGACATIYPELSFRNICGRTDCLSGEFEVHGVKIYKTYAFVDGFFAAGNGEREK